MPRVPARRAGHSTTLPSISSGGKTSLYSGIGRRTAHACCTKPSLRLKGIVVPSPGARGGGCGEGLYFPEAPRPPWGRGGVLVHRDPSSAAACPGLRPPGPQSFPGAGRPRGRRGGRAGARVAQQPGVCRQVMPPARGRVCTRNTVKVTVLVGPGRQPVLNLICLCTAQESCIPRYRFAFIPLPNASWVLPASR